LSAEEILTETCFDMLSDGPSDVLSESDDDDVENESYGDFEPEIARKIKKTVCHLSSDSAKLQDSNEKSEIYAVEWDCDMARTRHYSKFECFFGGYSGVKQICTNSISVSGGLP
jgi:hypothetical protein